MIHYLSKICLSLLNVNYTERFSAYSFFVLFSTFTFPLFISYFFGVLFGVWVSGGYLLGFYFFF